MRVDVSVVVPVFNLEGCLGRCLDSLVAQDFAGTFEVVVVNDGSDDASPEIIAAFAARHPRLFRTVSTPNRGPGAACNLGIERSRGDYVTIVEGDDWIGAGVIAAMHAKAVATGADLLIGTVHRHRSVEEDILRPLPHVRGERRVVGDDLAALLRSQPTPCGRLYARALLADPEVRFPEGVLFADVGFVPKTYLAARAIHYVDSPWYDYQQGRPGQSNAVSDRRVMDLVPALADGLRFCRRRGAIGRHRDDLAHYAVGRVLAWVPRVRRLRVYPVGRGLRELFGVLEEFFPGWLDGEAFAEHYPGRRARLHMKLHRATGFAAVAWESRVKRFVRGGSAGDATLAGAAGARADTAAAAAHGRGVGAPTGP